MIRWALKLAEFNIEREHRLGTQNTVADVLSRNPIESIIGEKAQCAIIKDLILSSREQLIEELRTDPELGHIYRYPENPEDSSVKVTICENWSRVFGRKLITPFQKLVMVSDGTEFAVGDIERLFEEARRNTEKLNRKNGRNIIIDVGVICKLRVLDVKNNNVVIWKAGKRFTINVEQVRIYRLRKRDEAEIGTGSSDNGNLRDESSGFDRVQRRSNESRGGKKKGSISSSWSEKDRMIKKRVKITNSDIKRANESRSGGPERKVQKGSEHRVNKRALSSNYRTNHSLTKYRKKSRREETVTPPQTATTLYHELKKREESRPTIERKTEQGGPSRFRKGRERNDSPYIEERTRSSNKNARRGGDQQRQDQERRGTWTKKSLSLEVLVGNFNYKS
ncbi:uncharacterized protein TNCV_922611 [Trichonephila clavipes]|nr:uncharacterized protein TNCV_922611 [Trichonephila clavipes]